MTPICKTSNATKKYIVRLTFVDWRPAGPFSHQWSVVPSIASYMLLIYHHALPHPTIFTCSSPVCASMGRPPLTLYGPPLTLHGPPLTLAWAFPNPGMGLP